MDDIYYQYEEKQLVYSGIESICNGASKYDVIDKFAFYISLWDQEKKKRDFVILREFIYSL